MSRDHRARAEAIHLAQAKHPSLTTIEAIEERLKEMERLLVAGIVTVVGVTILCQATERLVRVPAERLGYRMLIPRIVPSGGPPPAVAVDFGPRFGTGKGVTDCVALDRLVAAVRRLGPTAIAVDYDFGHKPDGSANKNAELIGARTNADPRLFLASLSVGLPQEYWIVDGDPDQAVHPFLNYEEETGQLFMLDAIRVGDEPPMNGMMKRLAEFAPSRAPNPLVRLLASDRVEVEVETPEKGEIEVAASRYLFNPATLDVVKKDRVDASRQDPGEESRAAIQGRIAIIGSSAAEDDLHPRPDHPDQSEFGLYMHAAGVAAFGGDRLFVFHRSVRLILDLLVGVAIVGGVQWTIRRGVHVERPTPHGRVATVSALLIAAGVVVLGFAFARWLNVLWLDFLAVAVVAALHPVIDRVLDPVWERGRHWLERRRKRRGANP